MPEVVVGRWGGSLAVRIPGDVARGLGIQGGERAELEVENGTIALRRIDARAQAKAAVDRIRARRAGVRLNGLPIRELLDEGRR